MPGERSAGLSMKTCAEIWSTKSRQTFGRIFRQRPRHGGIFSLNQGVLSEPTGLRFSRNSHALKATPSPLIPNQNKNTGEREDF
jgi:hypothetical protein